MMIIVFYWQAFNFRLLLIKCEHVYMLHYAVLLGKGLLYSGTNHNLDFKSEVHDIIMIKWAFNIVNDQLILQMRKLRPREVNERENSKLNAMRIFVCVIFVFISNTFQNSYSTCLPLQLFA